MFSITTTEASTTIPSPRIKPVMVIIFSVMPAKTITVRVINTQNGIEMAIIKVDLPLRRKRKRIATASINPSIIDFMSSCIVSLTDVESSLRISMVTSSGSVFLISSILAFTALATFTVFAPEDF